MSRMYIIFVVIVVILGVVLYALPKQTTEAIPEVVPGTVSTETPEGTQCRVDSDCRCRNFTGAEFIEGTSDGRCSPATKTCLVCAYD